MKKENFNHRLIALCPSGCGRQAQICTENSTAEHAENAEKENTIVRKKSAEIKPPNSNVRANLMTKKNMLVERPLGCGSKGQNAKGRMQNGERRKRSKRQVESRMLSVILTAGHFLFGIILFFSAGLLYAGPGTSGLQFLNLGVGAQAAGMGQAYCASADDISDAFWNPAGISGIENLQLFFNHIEYISGVRNELFSIANKAGKTGYGITLNLLDYGRIEGAAEAASGEYLKDVGTNAGEYLIGLSLAREILLNKISAGMNAKFVRQNYDRYTSKWIVGDVGLQYYLSDDKARRLGLVIKNLGINLSPFLTEKESIMSKNDAANAGEVKCKI